MPYQFRAAFDTLSEMLTFANRLVGGAAESNYQTILDRINKMANTEVAGIISTMQAGFADLNAAQARSSAALDRVLGTLADMPARIQAAVDAAVANGVDAGQLGELTALRDAVQTEVTEAQAEADRLEAASPAQPPAPPAVDPNAPAGPVVDAGGDTTGGGAPVPAPGA